MRKNTLLITTIALFSFNLLFGQCNQFDIDLGPPCYEEPDCSDNLVTICCHVDVAYNDGVASWQYGHIINGNVEMSSAIINTDENNSIYHCVEITCTDVVEFYINSWTEADGAGLQCAPLRTFPQAAVPVEFGEFNATSRNNVIELNWTTLSEINNDKFEIQKRTANEDFITIGQVNGYGNSSEEKAYSFLDRESVEGVCYYRIVQIDYDGVSAHSEIISVQNDRIQEELSFFPNPVQDALYFNESINQIKVMDGSGKILNVYSQGPYQSVNLSHLSTGVYFIEMSSETQTIVERMLKI